MPATPASIASCRSKDAAHFFRRIENIVQVLVAAEIFAKFFDLASGIFHLPLNYNLTIYHLTRIPEITP